MPKMSATKTPSSQPRRADAKPDPSVRKPGAAPQPLDLKTLERVSGGISAELPKRTW